MTTAPNPKRPLRSGELSLVTGVSTDTLRHYERLGILKKPPRSQGGYRLYPPESLYRVLLVRNALASGFTLKELVEILRVRDAGGAPCRQVAQLAHEKVSQLDLHIAQLTQLRDSLKAAVQDWDRRLEKGKPHERAHLLESLSPRSKRKEKQLKIFVLIASIAMPLLACSQSAMPCTMQKQHPQASDPHAAGVDARGDHAMGFSHGKSSHHFRLLPDGGAIEVVTNDPNDTATRDEIRMHLSHIAKMFTDGDFQVPMFIHDTVPPGVPVMKSKRSAITYAYESTPNGGQVRIGSADADAVTAIHQFLAFQIDDHRTGDSKSR